MENILWGLIGLSFGGLICVLANLRGYAKGWTEATILYEQEISQTYEEYRKLLDWTMENIKYASDEEEDKADWWKKGKEDGR